MTTFRTRLARYLRRTMTPAQSRLWDYLRLRQVDGWKFRRQHPIGPYFVDFYCPAAGLIVQIVSPDPDRIHFSEDDDQQRTAYLKARGCRVLTFNSFEVEDNIDGVMDAIRNELLPLGVASGLRQQMEIECAFKPANWDPENNAETAQNRGGGVSG
jgi:very-short-patch-repair endonuclease